MSEKVNLNGTRLYAQRLLPIIWRYMSSSSKLRTFPRYKDWGLCLTRNVQISSILLDKSPSSFHVSELYFWNIVLKCAYTGHYSYVLMFNIVASCVDMSGII